MHTVTGEKIATYTGPGKLTSHHATAAAAAAAAAALMLSAWE